MRDFWEFVIDLLPITFRSVSAVGLEAKTHEAEAKTHEAEATTHEAEAKTHEAEATTHEAEARFFDLEAEVRPRGLTSLHLNTLFVIKFFSNFSESVLLLPETIIKI